MYLNAIIMGVAVFGIFALAWCYVGFSRDMHRMRPNCASLLFIEQGGRLGAARPDNVVKITRAQEKRQPARGGVSRPSGRPA
jgi:hypothetical protein